MAGGDTTDGSGPVDHDTGIYSYLFRMSATPNPPHAQLASHEDDDAYYRAVLRDLIDHGAEFAHQLRERAAKQPDFDPSIPFDRLTRTIRRTIALARHIATNPPKAHTKNDRAPVDRTQAREKIIRGVEDAIEARRGPKTDTDTSILYNELNERLLDDGLERDLRTRPIDEIIEELARDLGVAYQSRSYAWKRRTPADIATLRAHAATPPNPENWAGFSPPPKRNQRWPKAP